MEKVDIVHCTEQELTVIPNDGCCSSTGSVAEQACLNSVFRELFGNMPKFFKADEKFST